MITKYSPGKILFLIFVLFLSILSADITNDEKINILTEYLMKQEHKSLQDARNEAIATIYGDPVFDQLSYDDDTEMFFGRVKSSKSFAAKQVNFYMPKKRAHSFKKNLDKGYIEVSHIFKDNEVEFTGIELNYEGIKYPMALKSDTSMSLKIGGFFTSQQSTEIRAEKNGIGGTINLQKLFNLTEQTNSLRVDFGYDFNQKHKLALSYYKINNSNTMTIDPIDFAGSTINGSTNLQFNTTIYKFTYIYSAYRTNKFEFMTRVGIHLTEFETVLSAQANLNGTESVDTSTDLYTYIPAPLPMFGLGFNYDITDTLALKYHVDYFFLSTIVKGSMIDTQIELNYMINDYVGLSLGLNTTKMDFSTTVDETSFALNHDIAGMLASVIFRY